MHAWHLCCRSTSGSRVILTWYFTAPRWRCTIMYSVDLPPYRAQTRMHEAHADGHMYMCRAQWDPFLDPCHIDRTCMHGGWYALTGKSCSHADCGIVQTRCAHRKKKLCSARVTGFPKLSKTPTRLFSL